MFGFESIQHVPRGTVGRHLGNVAQPARHAEATLDRGTQRRIQPQRIADADEARQVINVRQPGIPKPAVDPDMKVPEGYVIDWYDEFTGISTEYIFTY